MPAAVHPEPTRPATEQANPTASKKMESHTISGQAPRKFNRQ